MDSRSRRSFLTSFFSKVMRTSMFQQTVACSLGSFADFQIFSESRYYKLAWMGSMLHGGMFGINKSREKNGIIKFELAVFTTI